MCIILVKPAGAEMPSKSILEACQIQNPDGVGFMYRRDGEVTISKGYIDEENLVEGFGWHKVSKKDDLIVHFRWGTHGDMSPENTHPFPISNKLKDIRKLEIDTTIGIAHNGVLTIKPTIKGISDTMELVLRILSKKSMKKGLLNEHRRTLATLRYLAPSDRFALMSNDRMYMVGEGWIEYEGIHYSNDGFEWALYDEVSTPIKDIKCLCVCPKDTDHCECGWYERYLEAIAKEKDEEAELGVGAVTIEEVTELIKEGGAIKDYTPESATG